MKNSANLERQDGHDQPGKAPHLFRPLHDANQVRIDVQFGEVRPLFGLFLNGREDLPAEEALKEFLDLAREGLNRSALAVGLGPLQDLRRCVPRVRDTGCSSIP